MIDRKIFAAYALIVVCVTAVSFLPSLGNDFVDWDDMAYVVNNDVIKDLSFNNIKRMFTESFVGTYCPLTMLSYAAEYHFFDLKPFFYHLDNYILHLVVTFLVFYLIWLLAGNLNAAFIAALLFGIHPLRVESVAWVSERKDLLCALFYILALISYLKFIKHKNVRYYLYLIVSSLLSFISKPMAITIPFILLLLDYFYGRKIGKASLVEKSPIFIMSFITAIVNYYFQHAAGATWPQVKIGSKIYFLSKSLFFYMSKILAPVRLSAMYPYYSDVTGQQMAMIIFYAGALIALLAVIVYSARYTKDLVFGSAFFIITALPVIKLIPFGAQFAADRFMYLPAIGIFYVFSVYFERLLRWGTGERSSVRAIAILLFITVVLVLSVLTWNRCMIWKNTETLFVDILEKEPKIALAHNQLGAFLARAGRFDRAIAHFNKAVELRPDFNDARDNLALAQAQRAESLKTTRSAAVARQIGRQPSVEVRQLNDTGIEYGKIGDFEKSAYAFNKAVELDPDYAETYNNLGYLYYKKGDLKRAEEYFNKALELAPGYEIARTNLDQIRIAIKKADTVK